MNFVTIQDPTTYTRNFAWNVANWVCKYSCPVLIHCYWPGVPFNGIRNLKPGSRASNARISCLRLVEIIFDPLLRFTNPNRSIDYKKNLECA